MGSNTERSALPTLLILLGRLGPLGLALPLEACQSPPPPEFTGTIGDPAPDMPAPSRGVLDAGPSSAFGPTPATEGGRSMPADASSADASASLDGASRSGIDLTKLNGQRWEVPCGTPRENDQVCDNLPPKATQCPPGGYSDLNKTIQLGGLAGTFYDLNVRIRGVVEPKPYGGGKSDGKHFYTGGAPAGNDPYNVYSLSVSSPKQVFYFNHDEGKGVGHYVFPIDHAKTIRIEGGASVRLVAFDSNCSSIRNCQIAGANCTPFVVAGIPPAPKAFNGQYIQLDVIAVTPVLAP